MDPEPDFTPRYDANDDNGTHFEFEVIAVDWRGLKSSQQIIFEAYATPPEIQINDFQSSIKSVDSTLNKIEFTDPDNELQMWANSASAKGFNEVNLSNQIQLFIDQKIASFSDLNQLADNVRFTKSNS